MPHKKQVTPDERVPLKLTATERKLILNDVMCLDRAYEQLIKATPSGKPVMMTLDELDDFGGYIAAAANRCDDTKKRTKFDAVFEKVDDLLETFTDQESPSTINFDHAKREHLVANRASEMAEWLVEALMVAKQLRVKTRTLDNFFLTPAQRDVMLLCSHLSKSVRNKLAKGKKSFTFAEVADMGLALAEDVIAGGEMHKQLATLIVAEHLMESLEEGIVELAQARQAKKPVRTGEPERSKTDTAKLYQFKITLQGSEPPIWRRIQVRDCTFDNLHEHIQTAMGWTNSHLHLFEIKGERFGDPGLLNYGFEEFSCVDSTVTRLSDVLPANGKRFAFRYEYDFGDCWQHEIVFEGCPAAGKGKKYPVCLEGEQACPPEDVGGVWGYQGFLEAIANPKHEEHECFLEWCGGSWSAHEFDAKRATRAMKKGFPDWRGM